MVPSNSEGGPKDGDNRENLIVLPTVEFTKTVQADANELNRTTPLIFTPPQSFEERTTEADFGEVYEAFLRSFQGVSGLEGETNPIELIIAARAKLEQVQEDQNIINYDSLIRRLGLDSIIEPFNPETDYSAQICEFYMLIDRAYDAIPECHLNGLGDFNYLFSRLGTGELSDLAYLFKKAGILDDENPVHIHDLCGGDGSSAFLLAHLRGENKTSIETWEHNPQFERGFNFLNQTLSGGSTENKHYYADIHGSLVTNHAERPTHWIAIRPDDNVTVIIEKLLRLKPEHLPESVVIFPCLCCGFERETFSDKMVDEDKVPLEELDAIFKDLVEGGGQERDNARTLINAFRASYINEQNPNLVAKVYQFKPNGSGIIVRKKTIEQKAA